MNAHGPRILVPVDGSEYADRALHVAADLAGSLGAEVVVCHVVDLARAAMMSGGEVQLLAGCLEELQAEGRRIVDAAVAKVGSPATASSRIVQGLPIDEIEKLAAEIEPQFIVIGSHGRSGFKRAIMGSVAEGVARRAPVPVMVVPPKRAV